MRIITVIAGKELRQRLRDRSAYVMGLIGPFVLAALIGLAVGNADESVTFTFAVVDLDRSDTSRGFVEGLADQLGDVVELREISDRDRAERMAEDGDVAAAIVIPERFGATVEGADLEAPIPPLEVVRSADKPIGADVAEQISGGFAAGIDGVRLAVATSLEAGAGGDLEGLVGRALAAEPPIAVEQASATGSTDAGAQQYAPAMGIFFLFFVVGMGARGVLAEREGGTLARLLAAPTSAATLLFGKALAAFVLGCASLATLAVGSTLVLGSSWGDPLAAAAVITSIVLAVIGVLALILTLARTEQQARAWSSIATFGLALLGGNFIDVTQAGGVVQKVALVTPNGWALRAFGDLAVEGGGIGSVLPEIGAVLGFAAVTLVLAGRRADRLVAV